ncbi:coiled-coil domain-containing protein 112 [Syngnathoides biaculeatus]|uniref:coiled-coil domain-containing protein 112 n=1 Tax=Syngnathoides biaculeatus TaxID=300417 RepID=UPI002ADDD6D8|nr:coiled-coil domain-containing protein 112 [Syngnathoides biaculeatus]
MAALATARQLSSHGDSEPPSSPANPDYVDQRESRLKVVHFLKEAECTRRLVDKLEKDRSLSLQCRRNGWTEVAVELDEYEKMLGEQRSAEKMELREHLAEIKNGVKEFKQQLIDMKPTPELIEKLKQIMYEVEMTINNLKEEQRSRFGELLKEERMCAQEVAACEKKVENWSLSSKSDSSAAGVPAVKSKALSRDLPAEVLALEAFLQKTGGICGGWEEFDHRAFLKVWTKRGGRAGFRNEAKRYLPSKSQQEIEEHERWYQELIHLQDIRREAIQRWKSSKQLEHQARVQEQAEVVEDERKKKDSKCQRNNEEEKKTVTPRLGARKGAKRRKKEEAEKQRRARGGLRGREAEPSPAEELRRRDGKPRGRKEATKAIKYSITRDLERVQAKRQEKLLRQKEDQERRERIVAKLKEKVDGHIVRDQSRLMRPTRGWEERIKGLEPSGVGPPLHLSQRAVPGWRLAL